MTPQKIQPDLISLPITEQSILLLLPEVKQKKDDEETFKAESKDGKTVLNISSEDGDITIK